MGKCEIQGHKTRVATNSADLNEMVTWLRGSSLRANGFPRFLELRIEKPRCLKPHQMARGFKNASSIARARPRVDLSP